jgi:hypothetical protein
MQKERQWSSWVPTMMMMMIWVLNRTTLCWETLLQEFQLFGSFAPFFLSPHSIKTNPSINPPTSRPISTRENYFLFFVVSLLTSLTSIDSQVEHRRNLSPSLLSPQKLPILNRLLNYAQINQSSPCGTH